MGKEVVASLRRTEYATLLSLLIEARESSGLSQNDVARAVGLSQPAVSAIEHGTRRLDVIEFLDLAKVIGFDPGELLTQVRENHPSLRKRN